METKKELATVKKPVIKKETVKKVSKNIANKSTTKEEKPVTTKLKKTKELVNDIKIKSETKLLEQVISTREVKYKYPEDCQDTLSRKKFRQKVRNKLRQLELQLHKIENKESKEYIEKNKEYKEFRNRYVKEDAKIA